MDKTTKNKEKKRLVSGCLTTGCFKGKKTTDVEASWQPDVSKAKKQPNRPDKQTDEIDNLKNT
jgi:hypothetical protein